MNIFKDYIMWQLIVEFSVYYSIFVNQIVGSGA